jgi:hypothetical protein
LYHRILLPDLLYVQVGAGGTAGVAGLASRVCAQAAISDTRLTFMIANGGIPVAIGPGRQWCWWFRRWINNIRRCIVRWQLCAVHFICRDNWCGRRRSCRGQWRHYAVGYIKDIVTCGVAAVVHSGISQVAVLPSIPDGLMGPVRDAAGSNNGSDGAAS